jgi:bifunctional DNA-binding transcriptional regulator/antitoxin component of YhaV-PrlF toxin-antitoxin module
MPFVKIDKQWRQDAGEEAELVRFNGPGKSKYFQLVITKRLAERMGLQRGSRLDIEVDDGLRMVRLLKTDHGRKVTINVGRATLTLSMRTAARLGVTENYSAAPDLRDDGIYFPMPPAKPAAPEVKWSIPFNGRANGDAREHLADDVAKPHESAASA